LNKILDIIIPCYFEGDNIIELLNSLEDRVKSEFEVLVCYDVDNDNTLLAINNYRKFDFKINFIKNKYIGLHGAVISGIEKSKSEIILVMPADDSHNTNIIDEMVELHKKGYDIVCPSRFMKGGSVERYPFFKYIIVRVAAKLMFSFALVPTHDSTNGFRSFTKKFINEITIESSVGGTYSIELLTKAHRLNKKIVEIPSKWIQRKSGISKFQVVKWIPHYLRWFLYSFQTTYLKKNNLK
tara:strand:- start:204 stop:923 length:720 start_codon:yes stop_codon:yes gene_type:complete